MLLTRLHPCRGCSSAKSKVKSITALSRSPASLSPHNLLVLRFQLFSHQAMHHKHLFSIFCNQTLCSSLVHMPSWIVAMVLSRSWWSSGVSSPKIKISETYVESLPKVGATRIQNIANILFLDIIHKSVVHPFHWKPWFVALTLELWDCVHQI